eukprot:403356666
MEQKQQNLYDYLEFCSGGESKSLTMPLFLTNSYDLPLESIRQWIILIACPVAASLFTLWGVRALVNYKALTFDSVVLFSNAIIMLFLIIDQFIFCHQMFLISSYTILAGLSLYIFFKFSRIVFHLLQKKNLVKIVLWPYTIIMSLIIIIMQILSIVGSITVDTSDDPTEHSYQWTTLKIATIVINIINFISIFLIYRIFMHNRQQQLKDSMNRETFASSFIDMRIKQLKHLSIAYMVYTLYGIIQMILLYSFTELVFLPCYNNCNVPTEKYSSIYLFIATILFINMSFTIAYVFYIIPRNFNARIINHKSMHADLGLNLDEIDSEDINSGGLEDQSTNSNSRNSSGGKKNNNMGYQTSINGGNIDELDLINDMNLSYTGTQPSNDKNSRKSNQLVNSMDPNQFLKTSQDEFIDESISMESRDFTQVDISSQNMGSLQQPMLQSQNSEQPQTSNKKKKMNFMSSTRKTYKR